MRPGGLEPPTLGSEDRCSIQLSHGRKVFIYKDLHGLPRKGNSRFTTITTTDTLESVGQLSCRTCVLEHTIMAKRTSDKEYSVKTKQPSKFPLTLHPTGQYCKKIRGRMFYFGTDRREALQRYHQQASQLHTGERDRPEERTALTLRDLANLFLEYQKSRVTVGEIGERHYSDQVRLLRDFVAYKGPSAKAVETTTFEVQTYRQSLSSAGMAPNTVNNRLAAVKALFSWARQNELIDRGPNTKAVRKVTPKKTERRTFTAGEIRALLEHASSQMKAMILLGLNCGFGATDCSQLQWDNLDLKGGRVDFPRGKTGIGRNLALWPETIEALRSLPRKDRRVFCTAKGNSWVRVTDKGYDSQIAKEFRKLMKAAAIKVEKGTGFYTLRRTSATITAGTGDVFAVQRLLGHADTKMASTYVQNIDEQTDRAINYTRDWLTK